jgi:hypothetical protein
MPVPRRALIVTIAIWARSTNASRPHASEIQMDE